VEVVRFRDGDAAIGVLAPMQNRLGYDLRYALPRSTPMILTLSVHTSRASDLVRPDLMLTDPPPTH
jgi:hypothetical protein